MKLLNVDVIEAFAGAYLSPMYDDAQPTPEFHRECWDLYCSKSPNVGVAAPRGHAKSTALTHDFSLALVCFREENHILIASATEELAMAHLGDIAKELRDNEELRKDFGIGEFEVDSKSEIIVKYIDGGAFRIIARGSGQRLRGLKWRGRRPGVLLCDDMEEDEQVENPDRRQKFRRWVLRALMPLGRRGALIRWHGTIMHEDAMLARIMKDDTWVSRRYKAHFAFDDFSEILWPEMWSEERLKEKRQQYINQGDPGGYSQEYLNDPQDNGEAYIKREYYLPYRDEDWESEKLIGAAADFAITKRDRSNRTSISIAGKSRDNMLCALDQRVGRMDSLEIIDEIFDVYNTWRPSFFWVENGQIWASLWPMIRKRMLEEDVWINFIPKQPIKDKAARGRTFQSRMKAGGIVWPTEAHWFPGLREEQCKFSPENDATLDDQFDSWAWLALGFEELPDVDDEDFESDDDYEMRQNDPALYSGRNPVTGY